VFAWFVARDTQSPRSLKGMETIDHLGIAGGPRGGPETLLVMWFFEKRALDRLGIQNPTMGKGHGGETMRGEEYQGTRASEGRLGEVIK